MAVLLLVTVVFAVPVHAYSSWGAVAAEVERILDQAKETFQQGDKAGAKELVNQAYFGPFEKDGMERAIRSNISAKRAAEIEYKFSRIKKMMDTGTPVADVSAAIAELVAMLKEYARQLDGSQSTPWSVFLSSFLIIVREGFEAILIIGAITAYLVRAGYRHLVGKIYQSAGAAIAASLLTAVAIGYVFDISGASQEILEGVTMLIAVVVLFSVSFWLLSKVEAQKWREFIEGKVQSSLTSGSSLALWFAAFLAVYREGAETVLFYQALLSGTGTSAAGVIGLGFILGCVALAVIFVAIRYGSLRIPLKPFFLGTSLLLYYLAFVFAGAGMKELQEGGLVSSTTAPVPLISPLGIYPTWETLAPQALLLLIAAAGLASQLLGLRKRRPTVNRAQA
ncbi:hypothetical protein SY88_18360 [Clostridiales bacterium PH28_bin88]|nr:hypothetical protein SY88_18360 [Clostridiales bacterium PH28_bin88]